MTQFDPYIIKNWKDETCLQYKYKFTNNCPKISKFHLSLMFHICCSTEQALQNNKYKCKCLIAHRLKEITMCKWVFDDIHQKNCTESSSWLPVRKIQLHQDWTSDEKWDEKYLGENSTKIDKQWDKNSLMEKKCQNTDRSSNVTTTFYQFKW